MRTADQNVKALRVLVVEDDPAAAQMTAMLLARDGHEAAVALDGPSALEAARADPPDVVLLDLGLPGLDGYGVARGLRELGGDKAPLVIAVTGYEGPENRRLADECGILLYLVKPADMDKLLALLHRFRRIIDG